jgi:hypothetical protein
LSFDFVDNFFRDLACRCVLDGVHPNVELEPILLLEDK